MIKLKLRGGGNIELKRWLELKKDRVIDGSANLATSEDEALACCAAKILRYRSPKIKKTLWCIYAVCLLYPIVGLLTFLKHGLVLDLLIFGAMSAINAIFAWVETQAIKSAQDLRYDWAEGYRDMAEAWRAQRRIESERHLRMGDFYFRRWR